ncbi:uncharacterized protein LOC103855261 [Brassica rapa]|uniref:uncharacterized protein LOC103855261 n=1 Tax=Brassica campestris TaxID=3711 RepID=UPI0004F19BDD|nr:uncharacterized protein LOC103855261 [Brassica rapa]
MAPTLSLSFSLLSFPFDPFLAFSEHIDMKESRRIRFCFSFLFFILIISWGISPVSSDEGVARKEENPSSLLKIICGIFGKKFPPSSWELIQSAMQKIQMKLYPPNLDFRSNSDKNNKDREGGEDKGEKVKEAATRSLEVSKEAIEESAKLAGGVVGEVVHKTAEKVTKQSSHDEM